MTQAQLPLTEVVAALRAEIEEARTQIEEGNKPGVRFKLGNIDVEFTVVAKREGGGDGRIKFSILGLGVEGGASGKVASEQTQKVKLTLTPVYVDEQGEEKVIPVNRKPK